MTRTLKNLCSPILFLIFALLFIQLTGCGGGTTPAPTTGASLPGGVAAKVSDYAGTWNGTIQTNALASSPFTLNVGSTNDTTGTATVSFASAQISGNGTGTYNTTTHDLAFNFTSPSGVSVTYTGTISKSGTTLTLNTLTGGSITSGSGVCAPPVASSVLNLAGVWTGASKSGTIAGGGAGESALGTVTIVMASDGIGGFVGLLTDSTGAYSGLLTATVNPLSPTVWIYHLTSGINRNMSGGFATTTITLGADGDPVGGLNITLVEITAPAGTPSMEFSFIIQRQ